MKKLITILGIIILFLIWALWNCNKALEEVINENSSLQNDIIYYKDFLQHKWISYDINPVRNWWVYSTKCIDYDNIYLYCNQEWIRFLAKDVLDNE